MDDDDIDTSEIPDFAPSSTWAKAPHQLVKSIDELRDLFVPVITRETIIGQLWVEAVNPKSNPIAKVRALELIAELKGYKESTTDAVHEDTDNITAEEIKAMRDEFEKSY